MNLKISSIQLILYVLYNLPCVDRPRLRPEGHLGAFPRFESQDRVRRQLVAQILHLSLPVELEIRCKYWPSIKCIKISCCIIEACVSFKLHDWYCFWYARFCLVRLHVQLVFLFATPSEDVFLQPHIG